MVRPGGLIDMGTFNVTLDQGEVLLEALLQEGAPVAHDCEGTLACASCRVLILVGMEQLNPPSEDELDMLERSGASAPGARLACQAIGAGGELVIEVASAIAPTHATTSPVCISERAAKHFRAQLAKHPGAVAVRLSVAPSGCSGFGYRVDHAEAIRDDDVVFESRGLRIAVDLSSLPYVQGTTVDVVQEGLSRRVRFDNPNARQTCGCGESFGT
jgi:iron-sulfur cluster assembly protein